MEGGVGAEYADEDDNDDQLHLFHGVDGHMSYLYSLLGLLLLQQRALDLLIFLGCLVLLHRLDALLKLLELTEELLVLIWLESKVLDHL